MRLFVSTILLLLCTYSLNAQIAGESDQSQGAEQAMKMPDDETIRIIKQQALNAQFELHYHQAISQADLRRVFNELGQPAVSYGFGAEGGYYFDPVPLVLGGEIGVCFNGADSKVLRTRDLTSRYELSSSNTQIPILVHARFQPNIDSWLFPYVEAVGGLTVYSSNVSIDHIRMGDTLSDSQGSGSVTWNYGVGVGVAIKVSDVITLPNTLQRTLFDIRIRYLWGTDTSIPNAELIDGNNLDYVITEERVSVPQVVIFRAGFIFQM